MPGNGSREHVYRKKFTGIIPSKLYTIMVRSNRGNISSGYLKRSFALGESKAAVAAAGLNSLKVFPKFMEFKPNGLCQHMHDIDLFDMILLCQVSLAYVGGRLNLILNDITWLQGEAF